MKAYAKFHFPNTSISTENMAENELRGLVADIMTNRRKNSFKAHNKEFLVNPELVCYVEMIPDSMTHS